MMFYSQSVSVASSRLKPIGLDLGLTLSFGSNCIVLEYDGKAGYTFDSYVSLESIPEELDITDLLSGNVPSLCEVKLVGLKGPSISYIRFLYIDFTSAICFSMSETFLNISDSASLCFNL